jgi:hypothetical protein
VRWRWIWSNRRRLVNLWRPIVGPVWDNPLTVCDARSVSPEDLVATDINHFGADDLTAPRHSGQIYSVRYNPAHQWFYVSEMRPEEVLLLKCYDSRADGRARFMPHTGFQNPACPSEFVPRESIEATFGGFRRGALEPGDYGRLIRHCCGYRSAGSGTAPLVAPEPGAGTDRGGEHDARLRDRGRGLRTHRMSRGAQRQPSAADRDDRGGRSRRARATTFLAPPRKRSKAQAQTENRRWGRRGEGTRSCCEHGG